MGIGFKHGGSGGAVLSFRVMAVASLEVLPATAKEYTIAVVTEVDMARWVFAPEAPTDPEEGMVWFLTGNHSDGQFDALKDGGIILCPLKANQYINGEWTEKTASTYQDGQWLTWQSELYLFKNGDQCTDVTGGWANLGEDATSMRGWATGAQSFGDHFRTNNKINLAGWKTLNINCTAHQGYYYTLAIDESSVLGGGADLVALAQAKAAGLLSLDISAIDGDYYVYVIAGPHGVDTTTSTMFEADSVWLG